MTERNRALATLFQAIADLLATTEANRYRIRAYRRAADSLLLLGEDIETVARRGALQQIAGIGQDLAGMIEEFLESGTIRTYEQLTRPLPPDIAAWTTLPGLSEPLVQYLYFRLGLQTLADLEALVRSHLLRTLHSAAVPEEELLAAIHARRQSEPSP